MQRIKKPKPGKALTQQRKSMSHPNRQKVLFKKGNKAAAGHGGPRHKRFITMGYLNSLYEEVETLRTEIKNGKAHRVKEKITKERQLIEALHKGFVVDRNPAIMRLVMEMIEGKQPQDIHVTRKDLRITANMSLEEASRRYLESIKQTELEADAAEEEDE